MKNSIFAAELKNNIKVQWQRFGTNSTHIIL